MRLGLLCVLLAAAGVRGGQGEASFAEFDRKAKAGERLSVVFFGASLTWGANASDPMQTSYRAVVARRLEKAYPEARLKFHDAAIGGTGSQLGVFRLDRDVLRHKPDLVFLDFTANDDIYSDTPETLASYEAIVRRIVLEARCPVVQVALPFLWNVAQGNTGGMKRLAAHAKIAEAYGAAFGDAVTLCLDRVRNGRTTLKRIWPHDGVHPGDEGYAIFADAAWDAFGKAVAEKRACRAPREMLHADTYMTSARVRISSLAPLPAGWQVGLLKPHSAAFDMLMSRWLDDIVVASNRKGAAGDSGENSLVACKVEPLRVRFRGSMVLLLGESTPESGEYQVRIDGKLAEQEVNKKKTARFDAGHLGKLMKGNSHQVAVVAVGLDASVEHTLQIEPLLADDKHQEIRLESICVAGQGAAVRRWEK